MAKALEFTIMGRPVPFAHMTQRSKYGKRAQRALDYQKRVKSLAWAEVLAYPRREWDRDGPFHLDIVLWMCPGRTKDATNVVKNIEDGLTPGIMVDDNIRVLVAEKWEVFYVQKGQEKAVVRLTPLADKQFDPP